MDFHPETSASEPAKTPAAIEPRPARTRAVQRVLKRRSYAAGADLLRTGGGPATGPGEEVDLARAGFASPARDLPHRAAMERAFGQPLHHVKAHVGPEAAEASAAMGAEAYALGSEVAFGRANPPPETVAHEVAHVVQQTSGRPGATGGTADLEREADHAAQSASAGGKVPGMTRDRPAVRKKRRETAKEPPPDGSGEWGAEAENRGWSDRVNHFKWMRIADAAEALGLTNAARHMRHYLENSGTPLEVSVDAMLRDLPTLRQKYQLEMGLARQRANDLVNSSSPVSQTVRLNGDRKNAYATRSESEDWFFAMGGFTYWYTADVVVVPNRQALGLPRIVMTFRLNVFDRYNWDAGKSVTILGREIKDVELGCLHRVGLAREYEIHGVSSPQNLEWVGSGPREGRMTESDTPQANSRAGERGDFERDRD